MTLYAPELVGGLVGDALDSVGNSIAAGIISAFKYLTVAVSSIISNASEIGTISYQIVYYATKDKKDLGKIIKYIILFAGSTILKVIIYAM